ncbi:MAG: ParB/RepB/Spo0J family partition protein, partial [Armatimonadetes bacterium]|nr:ParB/RepB/Spo0J family partition protein [Armatimonadota bacterium]
MRRALGKGLSQLIGEQQVDSGVMTIALTDITANRQQPRTRFADEPMGELAQSIREHGLIQPIIVRAVSEGRYEIIAGERRFRAATLAGLIEIPAVVRSASAQDSLEIALIENIQREDISAIECARAYKELADNYALTQEQIAQKVGKSRVAITNAMRLLRLPADIQDAIEQGIISEGHGRALLGLDSPLQQLSLFKKILEIGLTVREVERIVQGRSEPTPEKPAPVSKDPNLLALENALSTYLGSPTEIATTKKGGRLT